MPSKAIFRFDASPDLGTGHAYRCLALAQTLIGIGWTVGLAVNRAAPTAVDLAPWKPLLLDGLSPTQEAEAIGCYFGSADLLVVDHYGRDALFETACRPWAKRILVLDDLADRSHDCDFLLDQTLGRAASDYTGFVPPSCQVLTGPDYAILRPQFALTRFFAPRPPHTDHRFRIVVSLGGSDPRQVVPRVLEGVRRSKLNGVTDVVLGASVETPLALGEGVTIHRQITEMARFLQGADLVIGAAGTSSWERCCLGLPTFILITADNQRDIARALAASGAAVVLGDWTNDVEDRVAEALQGLWQTPETLASMGEHASALCDGLGIGRLLCTLDPIVIDDKTAVSLRKATQEDCDRLFSWQNEGGARTYSRTKDVPTAQEHALWYSQKIRQPDASLNIVLVNGVPAGMVRLDRFGPATEFEVSILISQHYRSRGIGQAALTLLARMAPWADLVAEVHPENTRSQAAFLKSGFSQFDERHYRLPRQYAPF